MMQDSPQGWEEESSKMNLSYKVSICDIGTLVQPAPQTLMVTFSNILTEVTTAT
jgi:hypothetical protein